MWQQSRNKNITDVLLSFTAHYFCSPLPVCIGVWHNQCTSIIYVFVFREEHILSSLGLKTQTQTLIHVRKLCCGRQSLSFHPCENNNKFKLNPQYYNIYVGMIKVAWNINKRCPYLFMFKSMRVWGLRLESEMIIVLHFACWWIFYQLP